MNLNRATPKIRGSVKIKDYRLQETGKRGIVITLPAVWLRDVGAIPGDRLEIFRDTADRLIIMPPKHVGGSK
jgi:hypothetical protein